MSEPLKLRLEIVPGRLKALWQPLAGEALEARSGLGGGVPEVVKAQTEEPNLTLEVPVWPAVRKKEILRQLALRPGEVYGLLQGRLPKGIGELALMPAEAEMKPVSFTQTEERDIPGVLEWIGRRLAEEPLLAFELRGLAKGELLDGVFALWAANEEEPGGDEPGMTQTGGLAAELARLERKGPSVSSGEWLAEAAAEGALHQPGPLFHEIEDRPFPSLPAAAVPTEDWRSLLPQTPRAEEGLAVIMRRVSESAAKRASTMRKL